MSRSRKYTEGIGCAILPSPVKYLFRSLFARLDLPDDGGPIIKVVPKVVAHSSTWRIQSSGMISGMRGLCRGSASDSVI